MGTALARGRVDCGVGNSRFSRLLQESRVEVVGKRRRELYRYSALHTLRIYFGQLESICRSSASQAFEVVVCRSRSKLCALKPSKVLGVRQTGILWREEEKESGNSEELYSSWQHGQLIRENYVQDFPSTFSEASRRQSHSTPLHLALRDSMHKSNTSLCISTVSEPLHCSP